MRSISVLKRAALAIAVLVTVAWAGNAFAGGVTLQLVRVGNLTNVNDAAGIWQHEGGNIMKAGVKVGQFALHRRVTTGGTTAPLNTAMTTITLFFALQAGTAPENITLQGSHDFGPGNFRGSVGAASQRFNWVQGADAIYSVPAGVPGTKNLTIVWTGATQLTLP
jgi:hypothetical protein